jgi:hypothetical protein
MEEAKANGRENAFPDQRWKGLTKREWFAGMALQGLIACEIVMVSGDATELAKFAVEHADALLKQLAESDGAK